VTIRIDHMLMGLLAVAVGALALVFGAQRLLHHDHTESFTVKVDALGQTAYIVSRVPAADATALRDAFMASMGSSKDAIVNLTEQKPQGLLDCSASGRIGQDSSPSPELQPYAGEPVSVKIYGLGVLADYLCRNLQQEGF